MALAPFGDQFPLADDSGVYNSRISEFLSRPVNYVFTGLMNYKSNSFFNKLCQTDAFLIG
jgi:hypothetical protein